MNISRLQQNFKSGERVFWYRYPASYVLMIAFALSSLLFVRIAVTPFIQKNLEPNAKTLCWLITPIGIIWLAYTIYLWGNLLFSAIRFREHHLDFWDWRGRLSRMDYSEIIALSERVTFTRKSGPRRSLYICYLTPEIAGGARWIKIYFGHKIILEAAWDEIANRCELTELGSSPGFLGMVLQKPGRGYDIPPLD